MLTPKQLRDKANGPRKVFAPSFMTKVNGGSDYDQTMAGQERSSITRALHPAAGCCGGVERHLDTCTEPDTRQRTAHPTPSTKGTIKGVEDFLNAVNAWPGDTVTGFFSKETYGHIDRDGKLVKHE